MHGLIPESEADTVIFVVEVSETIPNEQESVASASVTIEYLFTLPGVSGGGHDKVRIRLFQFTPPVEGNSILELRVH